MEHPEDLKALYPKLLDGTLTEAELARLEDYFRTGDPETLYALVRQELAFGEELPLASPAEQAMLDAVYQNVLQQTQRQRAMPGHPVRRLWPRIAAAASILLALSFGGYWLWHKQSVQQLAQNDVAPFSQQAILKTGHGKTLTLDSNTKGTLAQYANTHIQQNNGQQIAYTNSGEADEKAIFDTLQVPAGGKPYHLKLADGSQVIVNVASAVRFPENFRKNNNEVQLIAGEAYFSIVHNSAMPLIIQAKDQTIEDVGTVFNVNTYDNEPVNRTTLVEGKIKVNKKTLAPGQQAVVNGDQLSIVQADLEQTLSWVKGDFIFNGEHIQEVMRQLARWYNIEVQYQGKVPAVGFYLEISRSKPISEVLAALGRTTNKVHFKLEGRRVIISAKK